LAAETKSDIAYKRLRREIVTKVIPEDEPLDERDLMAQYGLGRTPIREALKRLQNEQLLLWPVRRSPYVPRIGADDMFHLHNARQVLEVQTAAMAAQTVSEGDIRELRQIAEEQRLQIANGNTYESAELDLKFHQRISLATGNRFLVEAVTRLDIGSLRLWWESMERLGMDNIEREHSRIIDALAARDTTLTGECMKEHVMNAFARHADLYRTPQAALPKLDILSDTHEATDG
jgi:DNA-binding GntR family transcriptional regulator